MAREAHYSIVEIDRKGKQIWIQDLDGPLSITNDAERVVEVLNNAYPKFKITYCDTMGIWGDLVHEDGKFIRFG